MSSLEGLDKLSIKGTTLLRGGHVSSARRLHESWCDEVTKWLMDTFPDSGFPAEWSAIGQCPPEDNFMFQTLFESLVNSRLGWLGRLPTRASIKGLQARISNRKPLTESIDEILKSPPAIPQAGTVATDSGVTKPLTYDYISTDRIAEIDGLSNGKFDISKLVRLCEEINHCDTNDCYLTLIMATRAIIDHVPPIFNCKNFAEVANNYGGSSSFKSSMEHLDNSSRSIADKYLHEQIRSRETLPTKQQVYFANDLDLLLSEVVRILDP